jgi:hypothetical protein
MEEDSRPMSQLEEAARSLLWNRISNCEQYLSLPSASIPSSYDAIMKIADSNSLLYMWDEGEIDGN